LFTNNERGRSSTTGRKRERTTRPSGAYGDRPRAGKKETAGLPTRGNRGEGGRWNAWANVAKKKIGSKNSPVQGTKSRILFHTGEEPPLHRGGGKGDSKPTVEGVLRI